METSNDRWMKLASYLWALVLIPFFGAKDKLDVQFHAHQGMVLFGAWIVGRIIEEFSFGLAQLVYLVVGIFSIWGIINALQNKQTRLPLVADLADKLFKK